MMFYTGNKCKLDEVAGLENCLSLVSSILISASEENNDAVFKEFFPMYLYFKHDFKKLVGVTFIDLSVELYAVQLGLLKSAN